MFDIAPTELLLVAAVALVVIGPKELPRVMRTVGQWAGKARNVARQFRAGFDEMMRESELAEMERKWQEENARIMADYPPERVAAEAQAEGDVAPPPAPPPLAPPTPPVPDATAQPKPGDA